MSAFVRSILFNDDVIHFVIVFHFHVQRHREELGLESAAHKLGNSHKLLLKKPHTAYLFKLHYCHLIVSTNAYSDTRVQTKLTLNITERISLNQVIPTLVERLPSAPTNVIWPVFLQPCSHKHKHVLKGIFSLFFGLHFAQRQRFHRSTRSFSKMLSMSSITR